MPVLLRQYKELILKHEALVCAVESHRAQQGKLQPEVGQVGTLLTSAPSGGKSSQTGRAEFKNKKWCLYSSNSLNHNHILSDPAIEQLLARRYVLAPVCICALSSHVYVSVCLCCNEWLASSVAGLIVDRYLFSPNSSLRMQQVNSLFLNRRHTL